MPIGIYFYPQSVKLVLIMMLCDILEKFGVALTRLRISSVKKTKTRFCTRKAWEKVHTIKLKQKPHTSSPQSCSYPSNFWLDLWVQHVVVVHYSHKLKYMFTDVF